ncbi:MAG: PEP-CTERM sorting domain-containing protein [Verrucomicrobiia bacterium]
MKNTILYRSMLAASLCLVGAAVQAQTTLLDLTFDNPGSPVIGTDYIPNSAPGTPGDFNTPYGTTVNNQYATAFTEEAGVGVYEGGSPSGGLVVTAGDNDAAYSSQGFDFSESGDNLQLSMMFQTASSSAGIGSGDKFQLGLAYSDITPYGSAGAYSGVANEFASYRLLSVSGTQNYTLEYQNDVGGGSVTQGGTLTTYSLLSSEWYQMSISYLNNGDGTLTESVSLYDMGTEGTSAPTLVNVGNLDQFTFASDLTTDTGVAPEFRDANDTGINDLDNLELLSVPEPSSCALVGLGISALFGVRRFRRNK